MPHFYCFAALFTLLAFVDSTPSAQAQAPVITGVSPLANAPAATRTAPLVITFNQPLAAGAAAALQVFSSQRGGRRTALTPPTSSSNTITFAPTAGAYVPGETVQYTVTTAATSSGGALAQPRVGQFSTATSGTGQGNFSLSNAAFPGNTASGLATADVDADGDLDLLALTGLDVVTVLLNTGSGTFTASQTVSVGWGAALVKVADVDGDGDLDLLTANYNAPNGGVGNTVSVRLNTGNGTFNGTQEVTVGAGPIDLALGDIDGDGDLDFCTASGGTFTAPGTTVSVRLNNGSGTFTSSQNLTAGYRLGGLALGDVDTDGDLDLLVADGNSSLNVFPNSGGTFGTRQPTNLNYTPVCLATGDVDGDGDLDVLSADNYGSAHIHFNTGTGAFSSGQAIFIVNKPGQLVMGDVDADGDLDFLTASGKVFLNNGTGAFSQQQDLAFPAAAGESALADIDNDGDLDWLVPAAYLTIGAPVRVFFNEPRVPVATRFVPASGVAGSSVALHGANLTRLNALTVNGKAVSFSLVSDTLLTFTVPVGAGATQAITLAAPGNVGSTSTNFTVLLRLSSTSPAVNALAAPRANSALTLTFSEPIVPTGALPTATAGLKVYAAQLGGRKPGTVNVGGATLSYASSLPAPRTAFQPGEVLSVSVPSTVQSVGGLAAQKAVYQFTAAVLGGSGTFLPGTDPATGSGALSVTTGDVDGDGDLDLLTANQYANTVSVRLNMGNGTFSGGQTVPVGQRPYDALLGDVDGDGDLDLLAANYYDGTVSVRLNNGSGSFSGSQNVAAGYSPTGLALGDADADGDLDLFVTDQSGSAVHIRVNDGTGTFSGTQSVGSIYFPLSVAVGDLDGDGDLDFVASAASNVSAPNPLICVSFNNGNGGFSFPQYVNIGQAPLKVVLADVDQDGDLDFLASNLNAKVSVRLNNGQGAFSGAQEVVVGSNPYGLATGDVDGDGDLDLLTANYGANGGGTVSVCLNNGQGTFSSGQTVSVGVHPQSLVLGDLDGDGDLDIATANANVSGTLSVRLNQGQVLATSPSPLGVSFEVFPNPTRSTTRLLGAAPYSPIAVLDALGRPVLATRADARGMALLTLPSTCVPGVYLVRSGLQVQRLLVE